MHFWPRNKLMHLLERHEQHHCFWILQIWKRRKHPFNRKSELLLEKGTTWSITWVAGTRISRLFRGLFKIRGQISGKEQQIQIQAEKAGDVNDPRNKIQWALSLFLLLQILSVTTSIATQYIEWAFCWQKCARPSLFGLDSSSAESHSAALHRATELGKYGTNPSLKYYVATTSTSCGLNI